MHRPTYASKKSWNNGSDARTEWEFPIPILTPEFCNVECEIVLLRISHSDHAKVHWNVEYGMGIPHSNSYSRVLQCGMWNCPFENIPLQPCLSAMEYGIWNGNSPFQFLLLNLAMWKVELSFCEYLTSTMLKCNVMWNMEWEFPIPILTPEFCSVECRIVLLRMAHSNHDKVHWNMEYGMGIPHSNSYPWIWKCGIWNWPFEDITLQPC